MSLLQTILIHKNNKTQFKTSKLIYIIQYKKMKSGNYNIKMIDTGNFYLDGGAMFGVVPKALWQKKYNSGDELNRIPLAARPMLIEYDSKKILIDTGNGNKRDEKFCKIYGIDYGKSNILMALDSHGIKPEDISDVILTHLHFDHTGGSTKYEGEKIVPTFPNARYYVQEEHFKWAMNPTDKDRASFIKDDYLPLMEEGILRFTHGRQELFEGISLIPVDGHTKSLQMVYIDTGSDSFLYISDLAPTSAHLAYTYGLAYDNFPLTTIDEKKSILPEMYEKNTIVCFEHDAFISACRLAESGKNFVSGEIININS